MIQIAIKTHEAYCASANFIHCAIPKCSAALNEPVKQHDINWNLVELCKSLHFHTRVYDVTDQAAAQAEDGVGCTESSNFISGVSPCLL